MASFKGMMATGLGLALIAALGIGPASAASASNVIVPMGTVDSNTIDKVNQKEIVDVFNGINAFRAVKGLQPLRFNVTISENAEDWSDTMADEIHFRHGPFSSHDNIAGFTTAGEIIAARWDTSGQGLVQQWIDSPGHNALMSSPRFEYMGIGIRKTGSAPKTGNPYTMYGTVQFFTWPRNKVAPGSYVHPQTFFDGLSEDGAPELIPVTAEKPVFNSDGTYSVPYVEGLRYLVYWDDTGEYIQPYPFSVAPTPARKITVKAVADEDYKIIGTSSWVHDFGVIDYPVKAIGPTWMDPDNSYRINDQRGVDYYVNGVLTPPGAYPAKTYHVMIRAVAKNGFYLMSDSYTSWFNVYPNNIQTVTPVAPKFDASAGTYVIPEKAGVQYLVNGEVLNAGTYNSDWKKIDVIAQAFSGYQVSGTSQWSHTFVKPAPLPTEVTAVVPMFNSSEGTYVIPARTGVTYYVDNVAKQAGTYASDWKNVIITASAQAGYKLIASSWAHEFVKTNPPAPVEVAAKAPVFTGQTGKYTIPPHREFSTM